MARPGPLIHTDHENPVQMRRSYKFLMRPTSKQADALAACLEGMRVLYNAALEERREAWRMGKHRITYYDQSAQIKDIRAADPDGQGRWAQKCQQATLRRLDRAFDAFFRRVRAGERPGYPRFKGRGRFDSVEWAEHGNGCKWDSGPPECATRVYLKGIGHVRVHQHRAVRGHVKTVAVKREGKRWYMILSCNEVPAEPLPATGAVVGIDMGVVHFVTTSDGAHVSNPRHLAVAAEHLAVAQQSLTRKKRGSNRRRKARERVAARYRKVRRARLDYSHKTAVALIRDHDVIVHEALQVANMTGRPKPRPAGDGAFEPNGAAAKAGLNKAILDAGWGVFLKVLRDKAESAGRVVVEVNPRHTSQRCSKCGHVAAGNRVSQAEFHCLSCGFTAHADVNAAINILRAGLALQAHAA
jgi:putative transposase